jgi:cysteine desulfurase / selenocysteine lyase
MTALGPEEVARLRAETPGCRHVLHLNNAAASLMPAPVLEAMKAHLDLEATIGGSEAARRSLERLEIVYDLAAGLLNAGRDEIAVVESATRAWDIAFYTLARDLRPGDRILTGKAEYGSNYIAMLQVAARTGAVIEAVPDDEHGRTTAEAMRERLDARVRLIAVTHIPTNGGLINPVADIGRVAREAGVPFIVDACQSVGQMPVDVADIGCDMLATTGRKWLRGPRGIGLLYARRELARSLEPPVLDLHAARWVTTDRIELRDDARRFESWETNYAGKIGLGVAIDYALAIGLEPIRDRVRALAEGLRERLRAIPGIAVHDKGREKAGIVTFTVDGLEPTTIRDRLHANCINVHVSAVGSTRLDMEARGFEAFTRASPHYFNTEDEIDRLTAALDALRRA